jgi:hypothetical protein
MKFVVLKEEPTKLIVSKLVVDTHVFTKPKDISNQINNYFSTMGEKLVQELERNCAATNSFYSYCTHSVMNSMFCSPVDQYELLVSINSLVDKKSAGPDGIGPKLVRQAAFTLVKSLLYIYIYIYIYNLSFSTGCVPEKMKLAKVIPIFKKGDTRNPSNYRPISLLSVFDKLLEKIMYTRLCKHLKVNDVLYNYQFGFIPNYSTSLALIDTLDDVYEKLDTGSNICGIIYLTENNIVVYLILLILVVLNLEYHKDLY